MARALLKVPCRSPSPQSRVPDLRLFHPGVHRDLHQAHRGDITGTITCTKVTSGTKTINSTLGRRHLHGQGHNVLWARSPQQVTTPSPTHRQDQQGSLFSRRPLSRPIFRHEAVVGKSYAYTFAASGIPPRPLALGGADMALDQRQHGGGVGNAASEDHLVQLFGQGLKRGHTAGHAGPFTVTVYTAPATPARSRRQPG